VSKIWTRLFLAHSLKRVHKQVFGFDFIWEKFNTHPHFENVWWNEQRDKEKRDKKL